MKTVLCLSFMSQSQPHLPPESTWSAIVRLLRWDKPEGRLILMIPALWAVVLAAQGTPPLLLLGIIILGSLATSAAGCVVNDLWDRDIDPHVKRTRNRPLASRRLTLTVGLVVTGIAFFCALILSLFLNPLSFGLCVAAVPVIVLYPLAKRVFPIPQLVLAIAWGFAVLISWSAVTGRLSLGAGVLWAATVFWTLGFDTIYAMPDREDDRRLGVNSSALFLGRHAAAGITFFLAATVACLILLGVIRELHWSYWLTLVLSTGVWGRQCWQLRQSSLPALKYGQMFRQHVWVGFGLLVGMWLGSLL